MTKNIELTVKDVSLSAAKAPGNKYAPFIKVKIAELSDDERELMILAEDLEASRTLPPYYMKDISVDDDDPLNAVVVARIGSDYFGEEPDDGEDSNPLFQDVELRLPMPFVMLAYSLSSAPDGGMVMIVTRLDEADTDNAHISTYADFALTMPPENTPTYDNLVEKMEVVFVPSFARPLPTEAFTGGNDNGAPKEARIAQYLLFSLYEGLAKGSKFAMGRVLQLIESIDEHISPDSDSEHAHVPYLSYVSTIAAEAYRRSRIDISSADAPDVEMSESEGDGDLDQAFADIINGSELLEILDDVPNAGIPESNPFDNGFPESMKPLEELFQEGNVAAHLAPLIYRDGVTSHTASEIMDKYSVGMYVAGIILVTAARAAHLKSEGNSAEDEKIAYISSRWISFDDDPSLWELPALSVSIVDYDMATFVDLLQYGDKQNLANMPYLYSVLHELGARIWEEKWTAENLEERLALMDITLPQMKAVKELLMIAITASDSDGDKDNDMCPGCMTVITVAETTESIEDTTHSVSLSIPALADLNAVEHGLEVGSEEWRKFKIHYVSDFMREATSRGE